MPGFLHRAHQRCERLAFRQDLKGPGPPQDYLQGTVQDGRLDHDRLVIPEAAGFPDEAQPVQPRHLKIRDDHVIFAMLEAPYGLETVASPIRQISVFPKSPKGRLSKSPVIVHDQDATLRPLAILWELVRDSHSCPSPSIGLVGMSRAESDRGSNPGANSCKTQI
jgi:hypothetical protein